MKSYLTPTFETLVEAAKKAQKINIINIKFSEII